MATHTVGGVIQNCQHAGLRFDSHTVETATHHTGGLRISNITCDDCKQTFHILSGEGRPIPFAQVGFTSQVPDPREMARKTGPRAVVRKGEQPQKKTPDEIQADAEVAIVREIGSDGPGTTLALSFFRRGYHRGCQACYDLARNMNKWGAAGCRERLDEIVEDIVPRAQQWLAETHGRAKGFLDLVGAVVDVEGLVLRSRIRAIVVESLDEWNRTQTS